MAEPGASAAAAAATAAATGVVSIPILASMGIDPPAMVAGLLGATLVQSLLPTEGHTWRSVALITLGSVLLASVGTAVLEPWATRKAMEVLEVQPAKEPMRAATAAFLGAFAQPLVLLARGAIAKFFPSAKKEGSDA